MSYSQYNYFQNQQPLAATTSSSGIVSSTTGQFWNGHQWVVAASSQPLPPSQHVFASGGSATMPYHNHHHQQQQQQSMVKAPESTSFPAASFDSTTAIIKHNKTHAQLVQHYSMYYHHWTEIAQQANKAASPASSSSSAVEALRREKWATYYAANSAALAHYHLALSKGESSVGGRGVSATRPESPPMPPQMMTTTAAAATEASVGSSTGAAAATITEAAASTTPREAVKLGYTAAAVAVNNQGEMATTTSSSQPSAQRKDKKKKSRWAKLEEDDVVNDHSIQQGKSVHHNIHSSSFGTTITSSSNNYNFLGAETVRESSAKTTSALNNSSGVGVEDTTYYHLDKFVREQCSEIVATTAIKRKYNNVDSSRNSSSTNENNRHDSDNYYGPTSTSVNEDDNNNDSSNNYYGPASSFNEIEVEEADEYFPLALHRPLGYMSAAPSATSTTTTTSSPGLFTKKERKRQKKLMAAFNSSSPSNSSCASSATGAGVVGGRATHHHRHHHDLSGFNASETKLSNRALRFQGKGGLSSAANAPTSIANVEKYMGKTTIGGGAKKVLDEADYERMTVKGTCQTLEKEYLRLTSPPKAELVRPQSILEQHLSNLKSSYYGSPSFSMSTAAQLQQKQKQQRKVHNGKARDYHWYCSQLKAIRQDLTVQRIQNAFAVDVYETHAKIALEEEDVNEYNQSQTQLKELYDLISRRRQRQKNGGGGIGKVKMEMPKTKKMMNHGNVMLLKQSKKQKCKGKTTIHKSHDGEKNDDDDDDDDDDVALKNQDEFIAYRIIYYVFLSQNKKYEGGSSDIFKIMLYLTPEQRRNECIHHALLVRAAVADSNYHQFFQLQDTAPNMGNHLMDKLVPSIRQVALQRICKAYRPSVSVSFVLRELGFDIKRKKETKAAMEWMTSCGCIFEDGMLLTKDTILKGADAVIGGGVKNSLI